MGVHHLRQAIDIGIGTGNQDFTITGIGTPTAALFFLNTAISNNTDANHFMLMMGATDGTNHRCCITASERGVATTNTWTKCVNDKPVITIDPNTGDINGVAGFDSFITDGVRLNVSDLPPAAYLLTCIFFVEEGSGYDVAVGDFNSDVDSSKNIGFEPDQVFLFGVGTSASSGFTAASSTAGDAEASFSVGFLDNGSSDANGCVGWLHEDNQAAGGSGTFGHTVISVANCLDDGIVAATDLTSSATGFNISAVGGGSGNYAGFLAVKYNGNQHSAGQIASPTSTGNRAITGVGFQPVFVWQLHSDRTAYESPLNDDGVCYAMSFLHTNANADYSLTGRISNAGATTTGKCKATQNSSCFVKQFSDDAGPGSFLSATLTSLDADGFTENFSTVDASARKTVYIAVGPAVTGKPQFWQQYRRRRV